MKNNYYTLHFWRLSLVTIAEDMDESATSSHGPNEKIAPFALWTRLSCNFSQNRQIQKFNPIVYYNLWLCLKPWVPSVVLIEGHFEAALGARSITKLYPNFAVDKVKIIILYISKRCYAYRDFRQYLFYLFKGPWISPRCLLKHGLTRTTCM